jgi:hypothetical protein
MIDQVCQQEGEHPGHLALSLKRLANSDSAIPNSRKVSGDSPNREGWVTSYIAPTMNPTPKAMSLGRLQISQIIQGTRIFGIVPASSKAGITSSWT